MHLTDTLSWVGEDDVRAVHGRQKQHLGAPREPNGTRSVATTEFHFYR